MSDAMGTHLTPFERALGRFIMSQPHGQLSSLEDLASATVEHEPAWVSDAGTGWPEDTTVVYRKFNPQRRKDGTRSVGKRKFYMDTGVYGPVEFMERLFNEFE